ncbi:RidA family protein [Streptomyces sp. NPDC020597]|uniref:RidA family protein n=1 Tax=Streptomyces sp. NPDC020597 TaxID=3365080 RepID=UPI0037983344
MNYPSSPAPPTSCPTGRVGSTLRLSGQLPLKDGELLGQAVVGRDMELETARELARHAALNCLAAAVRAVGDLGRIRVVQMPVLVASTPDFGRQSQVANSASELLIEVLRCGAERTRSLWSLRRAGRSQVRSRAWSKRRGARRCGCP